MDTAAKALQIGQMVAPLLFALAAVGGHPGVGDAVPATPLVGLDGKTLRLPANESTAVVFFATWCTACHQALADVLALGEGRRGFSIVLIAVGEPETVVRQFMSAANLPDGVTVGFDRTGAVARAWGQDRFPTTFLVDRRSRIRYINRGYGRGFRARMERWIATMLNRE